MRSFQGKLRQCFTNPVLSAGEEAAYRTTGAGILWGGGGNREGDPGMVRKVWEVSMTWINLIFLADSYKEKEVPSHSRSPSPGSGHQAVSLGGRRSTEAGAHSSSS